MHHCEGTYDFFSKFLSVESKRIERSKTCTLAHITKFQFYCTGRVFDYTRCSSQNLSCVLIKTTDYYQKASELASVLDLDIRIKFNFCSTDSKKE